MKGENKRSKFIMAALALAVGLFVCFGLYYLMDTILNGSFVDWFTQNFMVMESQTDPSTGQTILNNTIDWAKLKQLLFAALIAFVVFTILVVAVVSNSYIESRVSRSVTRISHMINSYMEHDIDAGDVFPAEYSEIAAQIVQIKARMQQHEQAVREEAGRKNDMITYLAHDLKTLLTSVIGYLSLLEEAPDMPDEQKEKYIKITLDKALRVEKLTNEFFEITRYNLQQIILEKETVDLSYLLIQLADEFYPLLKAHGNEVKLDAGEELTMYADAVKLARVFNNILKNAISYSYPDTVIDIWAETADKNVVVCIQNRGKTIPEEKLQAIFDKFFRLDEARTSNTGGAGLGLAIAKEIVSLHGGTLTADSQKETTTFTVTLPQH